MSDGRWNHNTHYHRLALRLAGGASSALDVGCGEGLLTRELRAAGVARVTGLDLDPDQVARARSLAQADDGLRYVAGDVLEVLQGERFDLVTCFATLHHLDLDDGLRRLRELVSPGGHLVVVGLARVATPTDAALSLAAVPAAKVADRARGHWEHGAPVRDPEHSYGDVRTAARSILPGVLWRRRLYWRYSLVWQSPA
ncbi:class I SAM-dependent methyltransferase [Cellulomonas humilata]|uniref:2-polyprenyl-3-methyl-5-hydroxy-6-metoxy-1, 4-benzoquinol methylase n=1 Tax=Cellulomonas humilata TaxID=144055 RepID=A0ABU0EEB2_9CELL|nr:class I SAM-dependent methyltransferase [Cellulomonas humilata]MDQ0373601.1 2-polyprenyl-3-methyl-5-hydroxy-6-metoxy-1,4-benzoquinol methylase [Cellulomonas humilata]